MLIKESFVDHNAKSAAVHRKADHFSIYRHIIVNGGLLELGKVYKRGISHVNE